MGIEIKTADEIAAMREAGMVVYEVLQELGKLVEPGLTLEELDQVARRESLEAGIQAMVVGNRVSDIGAAVEAVVSPHGYGIVRDYVGHGIGKRPHEDPQVPNYGPALWGRGQPNPRLRAGLVLAVEPMINVGTHETLTLGDGWTVVTKDGKYSAHFEHTIAVTENGPRVLTRP